MTDAPGTLGGVTSRSPAISAAMEDYLKAIHQIADDADGAPVST
jgi:hypothetical protein